jgi:type II protein arginine methyltransferase
MYMRLKVAPWFLVSDVGPNAEEISQAILKPGLPTSSNFPTLAESRSQDYADTKRPQTNPHVAYLKHLERQQEPLSDLEAQSLTSFQDWLQSPLQPLSDNLESSTYEMFEGDPVKYDQYERAVTEAMAEWKALEKPCSSIPHEGSTTPELVVAVAGAGRGPLVTRVLQASRKTGVPVQLWALEKNQNAYVYLLRQNEVEWGGQVTVVKTDMREWPGPVARGHPGKTTKVDILVTELLGSFGDNELSPECLDGIQRHIARPHGISIPHSYTAHLSPISYPRVHAEIASRLPADPHGFETPWVIRLYAIDFVAHRVPGRPRFQQAWEFVHPVRLPFAEEWEARHGPGRKVVRGGGGAMNLSAGNNEHNARHCHLTFTCRARGVIHGLAGYFESVLYRPQAENGELVELSTLPEEIDKKSKDMISWFPIFFPLKVSRLITVFGCQSNKANTLTATALLSNRRRARSQHVEADG